MIMKNMIKKAIVFLIFTSFTFACKEAAKSVTRNEKQIAGSDSVIKKEASKPQLKIEIIYETENLQLYGDTTIDKDKIFYALLKFEPYIGFDDFPVEKIDHNKYADLDLKSNKNANNFRTSLREGFSADTANFAGHYSFVSWGCGSPCQNSLVIDRKTGKIYDSPGSSLGYDFRIDSKILIVNPPDEKGFYHDCAFCKPEVYIFDEQTKKFIKREIR